ncbi:MAG: spore cortex biosynthesis protein YabQ [Lachnospiraceae bacterium]|nr:spore cortex biosynthesis protein YabQ [Lachnospiraceae bacterium]
MANENIFLLHALNMGIFITFVYDLLRILRRVIPHGVLLISIEDILFWIYCAAKVFLLMHHESNGTLRWFAVLGACIGMLVYKKLVSAYFVKYVSMVLQKIVDFLIKIGKVIIKPLAFAGGKTAKATTGLRTKLSRKKRQIKQYLKKQLTYFLKMLKMNL